MVLVFVAWQTTFSCIQLVFIYTKKHFDVDCIRRGFMDDLEDENEDDSEMLGPNKMS